MLNEVNILLVGETGAGKSTTLNAIANYFRFNTFPDALVYLSEFTELVPSSFSLPDEDGKEFIVNSGDDDNERCGGGQSATVAPTSYRFPFGNSTLRIIDTPGIGDTAGKDTDVGNFDLIMSTLAPYDQLNGVVFVVNGQAKRKTSFFQYCIKNLLAQLHSSIKQNIVFCFTHSQVSPGRFGPGAGFETLEALLKEDIPEVGLSLKKGENCFFVENQAYRLAVALKQGYKVNDIDLATSKASWEYSVKQVHAMFARILLLPPHQLKQTVSINRAKAIVRDMFQPIVQLSHNLTEKMKQVEEHRVVIQNLSTMSKDFKGNAEQLMEQYKQMGMYDVEMRAREKPVLVCTASKCVEKVVHNGEEKVNYKTQCCEPCHNLLLWSGNVGEWGIGFCGVMKGWFPPTCSNCNCSADVHRRDAYDYVKVKRPMATQTQYEHLLKQVAQARTKEGQAKVILDRLERVIEEMNTEQYLIGEISAKFDYFINEQSLMKGKNGHFFKTCIDRLIVDITKDPHKVRLYKLEDLQSIKAAHQSKLAALKESIRRGDETPVTVEDILQLQELLLTLEHSGPSFKKILEENRKMVEQAKKSEKVVDMVNGQVITTGIAKLFNSFANLKLF